VPSAMLRMSAQSLSMYLSSFFNNLSQGVLQNFSSIDEMLRIIRQDPEDKPNVQYALIWD
jgi:hypothetical protein